MKTIYHSQNLIKVGMAVAAFAVSPLFLSQVEAQTLTTQTAVSGSGRYDGLGGNYGNTGSYNGGSGYNSGGQRLEQRL